ncbi:MAG: metallophosphoesterase [Clostridia bacterium]|nr:metallophosphoesterase [Clostridia bacterium]
MVYVISDLHGYPLEKFQQLLERASFGEEDVCYVLGDVIDRGAHGIALLRWILRHPRMRLICGNHEAMMLAVRFVVENEDCREYPIKIDNALRRWLANGGTPTLDALCSLPHSQATALLDAVEAAPLYAEVEAAGRRYLLTHSGLMHFHPDKPLEKYYRPELLWNRPCLEQEYYSDKVVVFGHTPTMLLDPACCGRVLFTPTWIDIDTGAAMGWEPTLLCLDTMEEYRLL